LLICLEMNRDSRTRQRLLKGEQAKTKMQQSGSKP
jgi:hypothetical protein